MGPISDSFHTHPWYELMKISWCEKNGVPSVLAIIYFISHFVGKYCHFQEQVGRKNSEHTFEPTKFNCARSKNMPPPRDFFFGLWSYGYK